jgi:hypothetical protein
MGEEYDPERAAALIKAGRDITAHLKAETELIKRQMERVLTGEEEEEETGHGPSTAERTAEVADTAAGREMTGVAKARWRFWR